MGLVWLRQGGGEFGQFVVVVSEVLLFGLVLFLKKPKYQIFHTIRSQEELLSKAKAGLSPEVFNWCFMVTSDILELSGC